MTYQPAPPPPPVDPATTRECDGYPGLAVTPCPCGDPADCQACP